MQELGAVALIVKGFQGSGGDLAGEFFADPPAECRRADRFSGEEFLGQAGKGCKSGAYPLGLVCGVAKDRRNLLLLGLAERGGRFFINIGHGPFSGHIPVGHHAGLKALGDAAGSQGDVAAPDDNRPQGDEEGGEGGQGGPGAALQGFEQVHRQGAQGRQESGVYGNAIFFHCHTPE